LTVTSVSSFFPTAFVIVSVVINTAYNV